jgi:hypothetical protein
MGRRNADHLSILFRIKNPQDTKFQRPFAKSIGGTKIAKLKGAANVCRAKSMTPKAAPWENPITPSKGPSKAMWAERSLIAARMLSALDGS